MIPNSGLATRLERQQCFPLRCLDNFHYTFGTNDLSVGGYFANPGKPISDPLSWSIQEADSDALLAGSLRGKCRRMRCSVLYQDETTNPLPHLSHRIIHVPGRYRLATHLYQTLLHLLPLQPLTWTPPLLPSRSLRPQNLAIPAHSRKSAVTIMLQHQIASLRLSPDTSLLRVNSNAPTPNAVI